MVRQRKKVKPTDWEYEDRSPRVLIENADGSIAGATRIVAIDSNPAKESFARRFGATAFVHADEAGSVEAVLELTSGGVDHAFECVGQTRLMRDCIDMLRPGGQAILLGVAGIDAQLTMPPFLLYQDKSVMERMLEKVESAL